MIHRDIKPENILLHEGAALVADFGIALGGEQRRRPDDRDRDGGRHARHYMSPEQARRRRRVTARSDVYWLGCVLYEMLSGRAALHRAHGAGDHREAVRLADSQGSRDA